MNNWELSKNQPFEGVLLRGNPIVWEQLKENLSFGTVLTGKIFVRTPFGVFFDSGHGFPVLMNVPEFAKGYMKFPDDYPELDSEIGGQLVGFDDSNRQLRAARLGIDIHFDANPNGATHQ
ncbi:hypothetical protein [Hymenobacter sp. IS2118]|uniref:hypothetical protein n=1 Tax=Hymenobacter sp. IS2118 TaxID=1505605 RepID=UPI0005522B65|nr:hypothetical protein [Hymenobacter sp. IS2118]